MLIQAVAPSRTIVTLMVLASGVALVENETHPNATNHISGVKIILGFTVGTVLLTVLSQAGEAGAKFAVGLAGITLASSALIYGTSFAKSLNSLTGTKASTPPTPSTPSVSSTPTTTKAA